jgi:HPt (histidine-containing phosphotransfer) domain-containing protein
MDGYVAKPVRARELFATIETVLADANANSTSSISQPGPCQQIPSDQRSNENTLSEHPPSEPRALSPRNPPDADETARHNGPLVDWSTALEAVQGDRGLLAELVAAFLQESHVLVEQIDQAVGRRDGTSLRLAAHTLKGSIRYFGRTPAFDRAYRLECMGRDGDWASAGDCLAELCRETERLRTQLEQEPPP